MACANPYVILPPVDRLGSTIHWLGTQNAYPRPRWMCACVLSDARHPHRSALVSYANENGEKIKSHALTLSGHAPKSAVNVVASLLPLTTWTLLICLLVFMARIF